MFTIMAFVMWKDVIVGHQWPEDVNGWIGLISTPLLSFVSFKFGLFPLPTRMRGEVQPDEQADDPHDEQPEQQQAVGKKDSRIIDWEKLKSQPPLIKAISILSLVVLVVFYFTTRQYIVTVPGFSYVTLAGGICLVLGIFLYSYKGRLQTFGKYFFGFVLMVFVAFLVAVYAGKAMGSEREWNDLEIESYHIQHSAGRNVATPSHLIVSVDGQPAHIYKIDQPLSTLEQHYGTDFKDSVVVDLTVRQVAPHFYVNPQAKIKPRADSK